MLLGIALHAAIPYAPFFPWAIQDSRTSQSFSLLFASIHGFRMPLFFLISGFFTAMIWKHKGLATMLRQRTLRILLPCLLATVTIIPLMSWITRQVAMETPRAATVQTDSAAPAPAPTSLLIEAIRQNSPETLQKFLTEKPAAINQPDTELQVRPLAWAALHGNIKAVQLLLDAGADPNGRNGDGSTALHGAVFTGRPEVLRLLLEHGADPESKNLQGEVPAQAAAADLGSTVFFWSILQLPPENPEHIALGREQCVALLPPAPPATPATPQDLLSSIRTHYTNLLTAPFWLVQISRGTNTHSFHLMLSPVFDHLWFLWFLCWMIGGFAIVTKPLSWMARNVIPSAPRLARLLTVSPLKLIFLLPTTATMALMGLFGPSFGPDTSLGLLPQPHVIIYYSLFFAFGCLYFIADDHDGRTGRLWWVCLPLSLFLLLPLSLGLGESRLAGAAVQSAYAWLMTFGSLGVFRRFLRRPNATIRWLSDASYWLYLTHLPLLFAIQAPLRSLEFPAWMKFGFSCLTCTGLLLIVYQYAVRYTWLGTLLNGPRRRATDVGRPVSAP